VFGDPTIADAVLDRLVHTAHRLALDGETLRKPPEKSGKRSKIDTTTPSEPLKPSTGELSAIIGMLSAIDRNQCPQSIGTPVRNSRNPQADPLAAACRS
jgi:IstB-like ATP binding protein